MIKYIQNIRPTQSIWLLTLLGAGLTLGAFYLEYIEGAIPCRMCWWQRYTHWGIWGLAVFSTLFMRLISPVLMLRLIFCVVMVSFAIGLYQGLGQVGIVVLPDFCGGGTNNLAPADELLSLLTTGPSKVPNCADLGYTIFNITLAWWNVITMSITAFIMAIWFTGNKEKAS